VLVPVWGGTTRSLFGLAGRLAAPDGGLVVAATFAAEDASEAHLASRRGVRRDAEEWLAAEGLEARAIFRVSRSVPAGLLQTLRGEAATLLLSEWHPEGRDRLDAKSEAFGLIARSPVAILLVSGPVEPYDRLVVVARREDILPPGSLDLTLAAEVTGRLAEGRPVLTVGTTVRRIVALFLPAVQVDRIESADPLAWVQQNARRTDLLILPGLGTVRQALERFPGFGDRKFLVAIAGRGGAVAHEEGSEGLVVGRSMTEHPAA
jgi:hypothetical protein